VLAVSRISKGVSLDPPTGAATHGVMFHYYDSGRRCDVIQCEIGPKTQVDHHA